jgi:hypothetical protein
MDCYKCQRGANGPILETWAKGSRPERRMKVGKIKKNNFYRDLAPGESGDHLRRESGNQEGG